jgi:hypothetical protein
MTLRINNFDYNILQLMRRLGYQPLRRTADGELSCVRRLGGDYPRFHIYLKEDPKTIVINIHLDQKKPSYEGTHAHGGDYDSETIRGEADRILNTL